MARFTEELSACENKRALEAHMERKRHFCDKKNKTSGGQQASSGS